MAVFQYIILYIALTGAGNICNEPTVNGKVSFVMYFFNDTTNSYNPIKWSQMGLPDDVPILFYGKYYLDLTIKTRFTTIDTGMGRSKTTSYDTTYWLIDSSNDSCYRFKTKSPDSGIVERTVLNERTASSIPRIISKDRIKQMETQLPDTTIESVKYNRIKILTKIDSTSQSNGTFREIVLYLLPNTQQIPCLLCRGLESINSNMLVQEIVSTTFNRSENKVETQKHKVIFSHSIGSLSENEKLLFQKMIANVNR